MALVRGTDFTSPPSAPSTTSRCAPRGRRAALIIALQSRPSELGRNLGETVADTEPVPPGLDVSRPNMARMYDYALGGKDNFAADRAAVEKLFQMSPENRNVPRANRRFLDRAVRFAAGQGIRQFLDLGAGLPSHGHGQD